MGWYKMAAHVPTRWRKQSRSGARRFVGGREQNRKK